MNWQVQKKKIVDLLISKGYKEIPDNLKTPFSADYLFVIKPISKLDDATVQIIAQLTIFYAVKDTDTFDERYDEFLLLISSMRELGFILSTEPTMIINEEENTLAQAEMNLIVGNINC